MSSEDTTDDESLVPVVQGRTVVPFHMEGNKDSPLPAVDSAEVLELGESTAGPSRQPSGSLEERDRIDDFFAQGKDQDFQCTARCGGYSAQERRAKKDRILPCFVNGPVCGAPCAGRCCGQRFRCCTRAGNFTVLLERLAGAPLEPRRELWLVVGPYWPFCLVLTTALMVLCPALVLVLFWNVLPKAALGAFAALTALALGALASVACRDPGLVPHVPFEPPESLEADRAGKWVYNDLTESWRPRRAQYDRDVNAVVREFDHVCPFTGTAIGENNLACFYTFVVAVQVLIYAALAFAGWGFYTVYKDGYSPPHEE